MKIKRKNLFKYKDKHSINEHNQYIRRKRKCPLCESGSKVVHETELE